MKTEWIEKLRKQDACRDGLVWASKQESPQAAWDACEDAEWMLWAWNRNCGAQGSESHRMLVLCCVEIAKTSVKHIKNKEVKKLVEKSLDTTERWARGDKSVTLEDVKNAAEAAWYVDGYDAAAAAAAARAAGYAADAAGYAADAKRKKYAKMIRTIQPLCPEW